MQTTCTIRVENCRSSQALDHFSFNQWLGKLVNVGGRAVEHVQSISPSDSPFSKMGIPRRCVTINNIAPLCSTLFWGDYRRLGWYLISDLLVVTQHALTLLKFSLENKQRTSWSEPWKPTWLTWKRTPVRGNSDLGNHYIIIIVIIFCSYFLLSLLLFRFRPIRTIV